MVWQRFGSVPNYIEPFFGSGAVLLGRPDAPRIETINDKDGFVANFWRAIQHDKSAVARFADNPVSENDLHARHAWLVNQSADLPARLEGNPEYFDPQIAGWWVWGVCCWIGGGFCSGKGPWQTHEGKLIKFALALSGPGIERKRPFFGHGGRGVNRQMPSLGDVGRGVTRQLPALANLGMGVNRKRQRLGGFAETGVNASHELQSWFSDLATRLRRVRICCGEWSRITGPSVTFKHGLTGVFLDPPYSNEAGRSANLYRVDCGKVAHEVRAWAISQASNPLMRIALCGYVGEYDMPADWECVAWKAPGGYGSRNKNNLNMHKERIWFSPHCSRSASFTCR